MVDTSLDITGGLPYNRRVRVVNGAITWPTIDDFEVASEIRVSADKGAKLKGSLTPFIESSVEEDDILLDIRLSGAQTRTLPNGFYDIVISDVGSADHRSIRVLKGRVNVTPLVTGG